MTNHKLFISYSHIDQTDKDTLEKWLFPLKRDGRLTVFIDTQVHGGQALFSEIDHHLEEAEIVLLLLSQDFLASDACNQEMAFALNPDNGKITIPIILRDCTWKKSSCSERKVLPKDGLPVNQWNPKETAWQNIFSALEDVLNDLDSTCQVKGEFLTLVNGVEFVNENPKAVQLSDIFVFPSITKNRKPFEKELVTEKYFFKDESNSTIILGEDFSGKTALLKWLFLQMEENSPTIFIDGDAVHKTKNFDSFIKDVFSEEFTGDFKHWFSQKEKVALVDNYHHDISSNFIEYLKKNFEKVIISMNSDEYLVYFKEDKDFANFTVLTLEQLTNSKEEELIINWSKMDRSHEGNNEIDYIYLDQVKSKIKNIILVNKIIPRTPFYILSILQTLEGFMPSNYEITAFGHCYQALIVAQILRKGIKAEQIDTCFNYLKELAYDIYLNQRNDGEYSIALYEGFKSTYRNRFIINENVLARLENDEYPILSIRADRNVKFAFEYIYYFFLGKFIADGEEEREVEHLLETLGDRKNAMILVFTIHHTQKKQLLDTILSHCKVTFDRVIPAELGKEETEFMGNLLRELPENIVSPNTIEENREEMNSKTEGLESNEDPNEEITQDELTKGLRIIEVLGQILKNRAGSFDRIYIRQILEQTVDLGLRILNSFLSTLNTKEFREWLIKSLEEAEKENIDLHKATMSHEKAILFVEKNIQVMCYLITVSMINKITDSIFSEKLVNELSILSESKRTDAYRLIDYLIFQKEFGLDISRFKELHTHFDLSKNYWATKTLSFYVQIFLNTHKVEYKTRQKAFSLLGISKYIPNKTT